MIKKCALCPKQVESQDPKVKTLCNECWHWERVKEWMLTNPETYFVRDNWDAFSIGRPDVPQKWKGFGGDKWLVTLPGRPLAPIYTDNLSHMGTVPMRFRETWPTEFAILKGVDRADRS